MSAAFGNPPFMEAKDLVRCNDGRESVSDHKGCSAAAELSESSLNVLFRIRVKSSSCFVQKNDSRILQDCSSDSNTLFLAAREPESTFSDLCVIFVWETHDFVVNGSSSAGLVYHLVRSSWIGVLEIVPLY